MPKRFFILISLIPLMFACSKKAIVRNYYLIEMPSKSQIYEVQTVEQFPLKIDVRDFQVAKAFEQTRIALRTKTNELNYFYYHHWAVHPSYGLADQVQQIFDRMGQFAKVTRGFTYDPDYLITGQVQSIERSHLYDKEAAHLSMSLQLVDPESDLVVVRHDFDRTEGLGKNENMNAFAYSLSEMLYLETLVFAEKISEFLKQKENPNG